MLIPARRGGGADGDLMMRGEERKEWEESESEREEKKEVQFQLLLCAV